MNLKIVLHLMSWEIDYALLTYTQLKKTKYHSREYHFIHSRLSKRT